LAAADLRRSRAKLLAQVAEQVFDQLAQPELFTRRTGRELRRN
jgi:hypothetical protein